MFRASDMLRKCPFCGSTANIWLSESRLNLYVECDNIDCMARSGSGINIMSVVALWNHRAEEVKKGDIKNDNKRSD